MPRVIIPSTPTSMTVFSPPKSTLQSQVQITDSYYFACGHFADLFRGIWRQSPNDQTPVAIKLIRRCAWTNNRSAERASKRLLQESKLWKQLHHPYIVPFYGVIFERESPGLVMPYYKHGDFLNFMKKNQDRAHTLRMDFLCQVAAGLEFLHTLKPNPIVHGDLKASNILISDNYEACLADFGLAKMLNVSGYTTSAIGGSCRWISPELLDDASPEATTYSDVWAFGMSALQMFTGRTPFHHLPTDATVIMALFNKKIPPQPPQITDDLWELLKRCWAFEPEKRPNISTISFILNILKKENLIAAEVNSLLDELESQRDAREEMRNSELPPAEPAPTNARLVFEDRSPTDSPTTSKFPSFITRFRRFSTDSSRTRTKSTDSEKSFIGLPLGRLSAPFRKSSSGEVPYTAVTKHPEIDFFRCTWRQCHQRFITLTDHQEHEIQHWISWKGGSTEKTETLN